MREQFNAENWQPQKPANTPIHSENIDMETEQVIARIEAACADITVHYADWLTVGFAFAHQFGEAGRSYFHRVSRFYNGYTLLETNKQYDHCLQSHGHGVTISSFFYVARQAGIEIGQESSQDSSPCSFPAYNLPAPGSRPPDPGPLAPASSPDLPTIPDAVFEQLPDFFKRVVSQAVTHEERDLLFLGSVVCLGSCLTRFWGMYDDSEVYPNLFLFVTAKASAGKGRLTHCKYLIDPVHLEKREQGYLLRQQYEVNLREYNAIKGKDLNAEKPPRPPEKMHMIPANNSSTGMFQILHDNDGKGIIFETEGDTLAMAFKAEFSNYSDGFRKAFHHERISYYRRTDHEFVEIDNPCLSALLSGTPRQVYQLMSSSEDGLFSRFLFYSMNMNHSWKNVFVNHANSSRKDHFKALGQDFYTLYQTLENSPGMRFLLSDTQQEEFNGYFSRIQEIYLNLLGEDYLATIRRLGLIAFRVMMVLTALRIMETGDLSNKQHCREADFQSTLSIISILVKHAGCVFSQLPVEAQPVKALNLKEQFFHLLPATFSRKEFVDLAKSIRIAERSAERFILFFCQKNMLRREKQGTYTNLALLPASDDS